MRCYSVTMVITNFLRPEFNRVFQEELIYTKFANFGEGLVTTFSRYSKTCKNTFISYESNEGFIVYTLSVRMLRTNIVLHVKIIKTHDKN